jgi:hypothetical protein
MPHIDKTEEGRMAKIYRYRLYSVTRGETSVGVVVAANEEEAKTIAMKHLNDEVEIEEMKFSKDGFCEIYYG